MPRLRDKKLPTQKQVPTLNTMTKTHFWVLYLVLILLASGSVLARFWKMSGYCVRVINWNVFLLMLPWRTVRVVIRRENTWLSVLNIWQKPSGGILRNHMFMCCPKVQIFYASVFERDHLLELEQNLRRNDNRCPRKWILKMLSKLSQNSVKMQLKCSHFC